MKNSLIETFRGALLDTIFWPPPPLVKMEQKIQTRTKDIRRSDSLINLELNSHWSARAASVQLSAIASSSSCQVLTFSSSQGLNVVRLLLP